MKILHTSDWHLGHRLHRRDRFHEHKAFLDWLLRLLVEESVDMLLVAGDIFDTVAPSPRSQQLYYRFLSGLGPTCCRHAVLVGGNHDSASFLEAPKELLQALNVQVVASPSPDPADEVLLLRNLDRKPELLVGAAPYLRERDLRLSEAGESPEEKNKKFLAGMADHYQQIVARADGLRRELSLGLPLVASGHLFTVGGQTEVEDGVRQLYAGPLAQVPAAIFPSQIDYLALGHLHRSQRVGGSALRRYSGAPLAMGCGEAGMEKSVLLVEFESAGPRVRAIPVPCFQRLERVCGDWSSITSQVEELMRAGQSIWADIVYQGREVVAEQERQDLSRRALAAGVDIMRLRSAAGVERSLIQSHAREQLDDLDPEQVFMRCLKAHQTPEAQRDELLRTYRQLMHLYHTNEQLEA